MTERVFVHGIRETGHEDSKQRIRVDNSGIYADGLFQNFVKNEPCQPQTLLKH